MSLRIATWNVNSVRLRLDLIARFVERYRADVLCLQETKVQDADFPMDAFLSLGFRHAVVYGMKGYNGVAILSRRPFVRHGTHRWCGLDDRRHAFVELSDGVELHNLYVPSGGATPDPTENPKFAHKLRFLRDLAGWFRRRYTSSAKLILAGDLNVAPLATDVWSHERMLGVVSHTPVEVEHLKRLRVSLGWVDAVRRFVPEEERLYTWWSYRARDWEASDRGRRLDHVWVTKTLAPALAAARVVREARGWPAPSDHVPAVVDLDL